MDNCLFCKIAKKELPAEVEYEDEEIIATYCAMWGMKKEQAIRCNYTP